MGAIKIALKFGCYKIAPKNSPGYKITLFYKIVLLVNYQPSYSTYSHTICDVYFYHIFSTFCYQQRVAAEQRRVPPQKQNLRRL